MASAAAPSDDKAPATAPVQTPVAAVRRTPKRAAASKQAVDPCPLCGGTGFVMPDLPLGHPDFGKATPCSCREQVRLERRLRTIHGMSGLESVRHMTFAAFKPDGNGLPPDKAQNLHRAFDTCSAYAQTPRDWLLITGAYGCGKTHLAAAIANARLALGEPALFMIVPDLLDHLRATFNPQTEIAYDDLFEQLRNTPLLVLDDFGAQSSTPWAQEKLFQLLNHRYNLRLPTVITTNQRLDDIEPRLRSRLQDIDLVTRITIQAPDFRTGAMQTQGELSTLGLHRNQRFDNFDARRSDLTPEERSNLQQVVEHCRRFAAAPHGWLILSGTFGTGKTHLAAAIANEQIDRAQVDAMLIVVPDLLDHLRATFSPQASTSYDRRFDEIKRTPFLVLDDLGTESATPWAREKLFQLLNYRYSAALPTVITTTSEPEQIDPWLRTRMLDLDRCQFCGLTVPGYRGSTSQKQAKQQAGRVRSVK